MRNIINIINFIRACDPRAPERDFVMPVKKQLELLERYEFTGTFLLEYDALILPVYQGMLKNSRHEIGAWFEPVQALAEKAGIVWRGRKGYSWDWYADVGTLPGYTPQERERLIDAYMTTFCEIFGFLPKSAGAWVWDAHSLRYLKETYGIKAACICKEQYGTDGYTLWGGYYNGGYYPSKNNSLAAARDGQGQISLPVFRMLGIDPVEQYDYGMDDATGSAAWQGVITLEPSCDGVGGADPKWVDWYFEENFGRKNGTYAYTQVGQENAMGWESMCDGLTYQFQKLFETKERYRLHIETLSQTGEWFLSQYPITPQYVCFCDHDSNNRGKKSFWYQCSHYRMNFFVEKNSFWIRDLYMFIPEHKELYLTAPCQTQSCMYYTLPVIDGNRWSGNGIRSGLYFRDAKTDENIRCLNVNFNSTETDAKVEIDTERFGKISIICSMDGEISIDAERNYSDLRIRFCYDPSRIDILCEKEDEKTTFYRFGDVGYRVSLSGGVFSKQCDEIIFCEKEMKISC